MSRTYYDTAGTERRAACEVPVDQYGAVTAVQYRCRQHGEAGWFPSQAKTAPACERCGRRMVAMEIKRAPLLPWRDLWAAVDRPLRPVWVLVAVGGAAVAVDAADLPALVFAAVAPVAGLVAQRIVVRELAAEPAKGRFDFDVLADEGRLRAAVARAGRGFGYVTAGGLAALAAAAALGVDLGTWPGRAAAAAVFCAWLAPAAWWWRADRRTPAAAPPPAPVAAPAGPSDADVAVNIWRVDVAVDGTELDRGSWKRIPCGWQATIVASKKGALNALGGESARSTVKRIAAAYDVPFSAITWIEAVDGTPNRAMLLVQPSNPLSAGQVWGGPATVDMRRGVAEAGRLIDGTTMYDALYRYGWGAPSEIVLGTTGGGKSMRARKKMIIERYASHVGRDGVRRGAFITILHDPKRMESYAEFRDAIHAYGTTRDDAHIIVDALLRECLRRYDFLAGLEWTDGKGRNRRGGLAWNPLVHGPVISHYWDEFHDLTGDAEFVKKLEKLARLQRACALRATVLSHMGTLGDTGSQALRDMMAGGRATLFRTTSALNAGLVTGGQLTADPRTLPREPGMCYVADGETASIMGRESYIPGGEEPGNVYDWLFDDDNQPIGFPADIPPETAEAFGSEFMEWAAAGRLPEGRALWRPTAPGADSSAAPRAKVADVKCVDAVLSALAGSVAPLGMDALQAVPIVAAGGWSTRAIRLAIAKLRDEMKMVYTTGAGRSTRHELTPQVRADIERQVAEKLEEAAARAEESE
jgi:hypothetical protein